MARVRASQASKTRSRSSRQSLSKASGTGRIPSLADVGTMHREIRTVLGDLMGVEAAGTVRILYGGSMNAGNAADLLTIDDVDGGLVGGASLTASAFVPIIEAAAR